MGCRPFAMAMCSTLFFTHSLSSLVFASTLVLQRINSNKVLLAQDAKCLTIALVVGGFA